MQGDAVVGSIGVKDGGLDKRGDAAELRVTGPEEECFSGGQEGAAESPGGGEGVEGLNGGEEELDCYRGFLLC